jgi:phage anti-repressor protein
MNELIKIGTTELEGQTIQTVNARELYEFLESKRKFSDWIKERIELYDFIENKDYVKHKIVTQYNQVDRIDYHISFDMAKEISMVERNDKGKQARQYFIECEKKLRAIVPTLTPLDMIIQTAKHIQNLENRVKAIEDRPQLVTNAPSEYFSILGYCRNIGIQAEPIQAMRWGKACSQLCRDNCYTIGKVNDTRYGSVGTYPLIVLQEIIGEGKQPDSDL